MYAAADSMRALSLTVCFSLSASSLAYADQPPAADPAVLDQARALDQQGVRAYKDGRYKDAIVYFEQALKLGGPSSELWNVAKCHLKLDEPEAAHEALDAYLLRDDLSADDREEAISQRDALDRRSSPLTVTSNPTGARVLVDGKTVGPAPVTVNVTPGLHEVRVQQDGYSTYATTSNARFGRAIVLVADLTGGSTVAPPAPRRRGLVSIEGGVGLVVNRYGGVGGSPMPMGYLLATYSLLDAERWVVGLGVRFGVTGDAWGTSANVSNVSLSPSCKLPAEYTAASVLAHALATAGIRLTPKLRAAADVGFGLATSTASDVGGDVFLPQCSSAPGVQPAAHFAFSASYQFTPWLRGVARPLILDLQPAYDGTRTDAASAWLRYSFTLGAAFDF